MVTGSPVSYTLVFGPTLGITEYPYTSYSQWQNHAFSPGETQFIILNIVTKSWKSWYYPRTPLSGIRQVRGNKPDYLTKARNWHCSSFLLSFYPNSLWTREPFYWATCHIDLYPIILYKKYLISFSNNLMYLKSPFLNVQLHITVFGRFIEDLWGSESIHEQHTNPTQLPFRPFCRCHQGTSAIPWYRQHCL